METAKHFLTQLPKPPNGPIDSVKVHLVGEGHETGAKVLLNLVDVRRPHDLVRHPDGLVHGRRQLGPDPRHDRRLVGGAGLLLAVPEQHADGVDLGLLVIVAEAEHHVVVLGLVVAVRHLLRVDGQGGDLLDGATRHGGGDGGALRQDEGDVDVARHRGPFLLGLLVFGLAVLGLVLFILEAELDFLLGAGNASGDL
ncbi:hypothetical protein PG984_007078 [Apiospora sp. TS-2023a]